MEKILVGDTVIVTAGKDKGQQGKVLRIVRKRGSMWVLVDGVNKVTKHVKPNPSANIEGGIVTKEKLLHRSNVSLVDANGKPSKIGIREEGDKRVRFFKTTGDVVEAQQK